MSEELTPAGAMAVVGAAADCSDHRIEYDFTEADIEVVLYSDETGDRSNYDDTSSEVIFRLKNGKYVHASEWSDSSGHG